MPISATELRVMLRGDAVSLALCGLLVGVAFLTVTVAVAFRRRAIALLWIAVFAHLYGLRLLIRTETFRFYAGMSQIGWDYMEAAITYAVPIPIALFARSMFPAWKRFWSWGAVGLAAFAACAIASDVIQEKPSSATTLNNLIAIAFFVRMLISILRPASTLSGELRTIRIGALAVCLTAVADNVRGIGLFTFRGPDLEPFGFTVLVACLGVTAGRQVISDVNRLISINRELDIARRIQTSILPQTMPCTPELTIAARHRPMTAVAGDFYDFIELDRRRLGILVADVAGHGVPAALIASMVKVALAAQRDHADHPAKVLTGMNEVLCGRLAGQYVTAAYLFIEGEAGLLRYGAAGHPSMLRLNRGDRHVDEIEHNGVILGLLEGLIYSELETPLEAHERFLLYTDGLIEASRPDEAFFGIERLKASLRQSALLDADLTADDVLTTVDRWSSRALGDDVTLLVIDWSSAEASLHCGELPG